MIIMKNKWTLIEEPNTGDISSIEELYGAFNCAKLVQFKTSCHRVVVGFITEHHSFVGGAWVDSEESWNFPKRDRDFLQNNKPTITHYRILQKWLKHNKSERIRIKKCFGYRNYGNVVIKRYFNNK
ncbi:MAG: hypothetical protein NF693_09230 [Bombella sp.]|nr:hypothetical protein [Bombella sp.]